MYADFSASERPAKHDKLSKCSCTLCLSSGLSKSIKYALFFDFCYKTNICAIKIIDFNLKIKISTRLYSRILILIFKLKSVNDKSNTSFVKLLLWFLLISSNSQ